MFSLESICLNVVVEEFERFFSTLMVSKDESLKRDYHFLQRKYAYELLSELSNRRKLKCQYLDFLVNEHLEWLICDWLTDTRYENAIGDILCRVPNMTKISSVHSICNDKILENIAKFCPKIVEIHSCKSSVTDKGVNYLCKNESGTVPCPKLKRLIGDFNGVSDEGLACLIRDLPSLETTFSTHIPWILYSMHKDLSGLKNVQKYNFVQLNLLFQRDLFIGCYSDLLKICLTVCPRLKDFCCYISDEEQLNFFENNELYMLYIEFSETEPKMNVNNFLKRYCGNLTSLHIVNCIISASVLAASCPKLEDLHADNITFLDEDSQPVFNCLVSCTFANIRDISSINAARFLLSSSKLEDLQIFSCVLSPDAKTYILKCCENYHVRNISLDDILEMNFVKSILCSPSLEFLYLSEYDWNHAEKRELEAFSDTLITKPTIYFDE